MAKWADYVKSDRYSGKTENFEQRHSYYTQVVDGRHTPLLHHRSNSVAKLYHTVPPLVTAFPTLQHSLLPSPFQHLCVTPVIAQHSLLTFGRWVSAVTVIIN